MNNLEKLKALGVEVNTVRSIADIAYDISRNWITLKRTQGAYPYLEAMFRLIKISDNYGCDSAKEIILYFLSNASTYRGARATELKNELRAIIGEKPKYPKAKKPKVEKDLRSPDAIARDERLIAESNRRHELLKYYPNDVYDTDQLRENFEVHSFLAPCVIVTRKSDGEKGTLFFDHMPRFYYNFVADKE